MITKEKKKEEKSYYDQFITKQDKKYKVNLSGEDVEEKCSLIVTMVILVDLLNPCNIV